MSDDRNKYCVMTVHLVLCGHDCPGCGCCDEPQSETPPDIDPAYEQARADQC